MHVGLKTLNFEGIWEYMYVCVYLMNLLITISPKILNPKQR